MDLALCVGITPGVLAAIAPGVPAPEEVRAVGPGHRTPPQAAEVAVIIRQEQRRTEAVTALTVGTWDKNYVSVSTATTHQPTVLGDVLTPTWSPVTLEMDKTWQRVFTISSRK